MEKKFHFSRRFNDCIWMLLSIKWTLAREKEGESASRPVGHQSRLRQTRTKDFHENKISAPASVERCCLSGRIDSNSVAKVILRVLCQRATEKGMRIIAMERKFCFIWPVLRLFRFAATDDETATAAAEKKNTTNDDDTIEWILSSLCCLCRLIRGFRISFQAKSERSSSDQSNNKRELKPKKVECACATEN